jgi:hypothetical protein
MAETLKVIDWRIDQGNTRLVDSANSSVYVPEVIIPFGSKILFRASVQYSDGTAFSFPAGTTFVFLLDNSFVTGHADLVTSEDFNGGYWNQESLNDGRISWKANFNTTELRSALGSDASKSMTAELWMLAPGGEYALLLQVTVTVKNIVGEVTGTPSTPGVTYATLEALNARMGTGIAFERDGDTAWLTIDGIRVQSWSKP